jgi:histidinol phosphatase-like enzyme
MIEPILNKYTNVIFLDHDGVLNCQLFYTEKFKHLERFDGIPLYKVVKKFLRKLVKEEVISDLDYYKSQTCEKRIDMLNELCKETNSAIVLSASMRSGWSVEDLQRIFNYCGATFTIIDKTGYCNCRIRGVEIHNWLKDNCMKWFGVEYYDFYRYAIIDDDSDMLLNQQYNFFQTDNYNGLTPTTCYKIKRFFTHKTF